MSRPTIIINDLDAERIDILLEQPAYAGLPIADALNAELDRAQMCSPEEMPHDVVTMNSRVKFRNLSDGWGCALAIPFTGNFRAALQPTLKCWNSNTSQKLLATTCFNPICTSDNSLCPEDALASSLRKISNFSWFSLFTFAAKLFRFVCGNNHGRSILHPDRISDYGGDYRHGCPLPRKPLLTIILFPPASHSPDLKPPSAPPLRFVHRVPESPYGTPLHVFRKSHIPGRPLQTAYSG